MIICILELYLVQEGPEVYSFGIKLYNYFYGSILRKIIIKIKIRRLLQDNI